MTIINFLLQRCTLSLQFLIISVSLSSFEVFFLTFQTFNSKGKFINSLLFLIEIELALIKFSNFLFSICHLVSLSSSLFVPSSSSIGFFLNFCLFFFKEFDNSFCFSLDNCILAGEVFLFLGDPIFEDTVTFSYEISFFFQIGNFLFISLST